MFFYFFWISNVIAFLFSLFLAYWLTKRTYIKRCKRSIFAPFLGLAVMVASTSPIWGQHLYDSFNNPIYPEWTMVGLARYIFFVFPLVFLAQFVFSTIVYNRLKKKDEAAGDEPKVE